MTAPPRVSIGVPVFNGERYLGATLDSLSSQDYTDLEIIISDNDSTDATEQIAREAARRDSRIIYLRNDTNVGGPRNSHRLVAVARGELFKYAYYDDVCAPSLIKRSVETLDDAGPSAVLAYPRVLVIDEDDQVVDEHDDAALGLDAPEPHVRLYRLLRGVVTQVDFGLIRMDALRSTRGVSTALGGEFVFSTELCLRGRLVAVPEQLLRIRRHAAQHGGNRGSEAAWVNPNMKRTAFPHTQSTGLLWAAVYRAPLPRAEKLRCCWSVVSGWTAPNWRRIARDVKHLPDDLFPGLRRA